ncbi:HIT-like domain-containing protein [Gongronella butleri]|nr:HIT-like domain-containing protein [Gongronella butleri]
MPSLQDQIQSTFTSAKASGNCFVFESEVSTNKDHGIEFQINYVPTLAKKPVPSSIHPEKGKKPVNPFLNPDPGLIVQSYDHYHLLLNKFCVVPYHLLIVTKEFQDQSQPLLPPDLLIAWRTMQEAYTTPGLIFYNCGDESGASQQHKHVQLIPLDGKGIQPPIQALFNKIDNPKHGEIYSLNELPFVHVLLLLDAKVLENKDDEIVEEYLGEMFFGLLDAMFQQLRIADPERPRGTKASYNFIMTSRYMMLVPRRAECGVLKSSSGNVLRLSMNSMSFAGFLLAKTREERSTLQYTNDLLAFLTQLGYERKSPETEQEMETLQEEDTEA